MYSEKLLFLLMKHSLLIKAERSCEAQRSNVLEGQGILFSRPE